MQYIIGVDIGTSGTKAIALALDGRVLDIAYQSYDPIETAPGFHELDPATLLDASVKTIGTVLEKTRTVGKPAGVSFSCALHSLIVVDASGRPLTNAITWADLRSKEYATKLKGTPPGIELYNTTGTPVHAMSPLCKIMWLRDHQPSIFQKAFKFISIKEYIWQKFFKKYQADYSLVSGTGLFDIRKLVWNPGSLLTAGITENQLSSLVAPTHRETELDPFYKKLWGLDNDLPFIIGGNDGCLANLGSNAIQPGHLAVTIGTSGAVRMAGGTPRPDPQQRIFNYLLTEDICISGGGTNNGGNVVKWFIESFTEKKPTDTEFSAIVRGAFSLENGSDGLICLPYLLGERAPIWNADAKGVFFGVSADHTKIHFLRAVLEGIVFSLYQIGVSLEETVEPIKRIYVSGGFIHTEPWVQMIADIFNKEVIVTGVADASAVGAGVLGFKSLGLIDDLKDGQSMIPVAKTFLPDQNRHDRYMKDFEAFKLLYERVKDLFQNQ